MEENENFAINDDKAAEWALKKIAAETAEAKRLTDVCDEMIAEYALKKAQYAEQLESKTAYLKGLLNGYFLTVPHKETKTQETYKLPSGKLVYKYAKPKYEVDNLVLADFLANNGYNEFVEVTPKAKWGDFKKLVDVVDGKVVDENGQIVEGVSVEMTQPEFEVEI